MTGIFVMPAGFSCGWQDTPTEKTPFSARQVEKAPRAGNRKAPSSLPKRTATDANAAKC